MTFINKTHNDNYLQTVLAESHLFSSLDLHFANFMARLAKTDSFDTGLAAALVSFKTGEGNICLDLNEYAGKVLQTSIHESTSGQFTCPPIAEWTEHLMKSGLVGQGQGSTPLVLDNGGRLYLRRYWEYEKTIINFILERAQEVTSDIDYCKIAEDIKKIFPAPANDRTDLQKIAAITAITRFFTVISGGPGTGKTSTVARILALLIVQYEHKKLRILLGGPTGKAAARLQEAIISTGLLQDMTDMIQATTLHRMLGAMPDSPYFRHNRENPLAADIIVIDEASMVDLPLMAKLMQAVPASARLILLGDRHQLASVQPGSVLGDICHPKIMNCFTDTFRHKISELTGDTLPTQAPHDIQISPPELQDSFVELVDNYRFSEKSTIARLSNAVKEGKADEALQLLHDDKTNQVSWSDIPAPDELEGKLLQWQGFAEYTSMHNKKGPDECFAVIDKFRILCGLRRGPYGMEQINSLLAHQLINKNSSLSQAQSFQIRHSSTFSAGQPVMVTRNDYNLALYNGDVGIILPEPENKNTLRVFFRDESGTIRNVGLSLLPEHETVFAMTVHKSQGSEYDNVLIILPDRDSPLLTRELLYTAITRARNKVSIWSSENIFAAAVKRSIRRTSGLSETLYGK